MAFTHFSSLAKIAGVTSVLHFSAIFVEQPSIVLTKSKKEEVALWAMSKKVVVLGGTDNIAQSLF